MKYEKMNVYFDSMLFEHFSWEYLQIQPPSQVTLLSMQGDKNSEKIGNWQNCERKILHAAPFMKEIEKKMKKEDRNRG